MVDFALFYPTRDAGEDDYVALGLNTAPSAEVEVVYFPWPGDAENLNVLSTDAKYNLVRDLGSEDHLRSTLPAAIATASSFDVAIFAVTSASFLLGTEGVQRQIDVLAELTDKPATSTTKAFQQALAALNITRVDLASVYHSSASDHFVRRLSDVGVEVIGRIDADAASDRELATWNGQQLVDLVKQSLSGCAEAVVVPETALHTFGLGDVLDAAAGLPVLTATQVTLWHAYQLVDVSPQAQRAGRLFEINA